MLTERGPAIQDGWGHDRQDPHEPPPLNQLRASVGRQTHSIHFAIQPASSLTFHGVGVGLLALLARRQRGRRHEHHERAIHPHAGDRRGQEQVDVLDKAQGPVRAGGGQEDYVAGDRRRLLWPASAVGWQITGWSRRGTRACTSSRPAPHSVYGCRTTGSASTPSAGRLPRSCRCSSTWPTARQRQHQQRPARAARHRSAAAHHRPTPSAIGRSPGAPPRCP
jgi:hypothetical protein